VSFVQSLRIYEFHSEVTKYAIFTLTPRTLSNAHESETLLDTMIRKCVRSEGRILTHGS